MPILGKGPMPKISRGSRMMFAMQPQRRLTMVTFMLPTAWKIFSKAMLRETTRVKRKATKE